MSVVPYRSYGFSFLFAVLLGLSFGAAAPNADACDLRDGGFISRILPSGNWYVRTLTLLPKNFDPSKRYGVVYFLHGRGGDRNILRDLDACNQVDRYVDSGNTPFVMVAVDGQNFYWMNGARNGIRYGDVVTQELVRDTESKYPVIPDSRARILAGISMGGHGAIQLTLNNAGVYGAVAGHSPVFRTQEEASADFPDDFGTGVDYQYRDPFSLMLIFGRRLNAPLFMDMGARDVFLRNTVNFANTIRSLGIPAEIHVGEDPNGAHEMGYWRGHFSEYLRWYGQHLPRP